MSVQIKFLSFLACMLLTIGLVDPVMAQPVPAAVVSGEDKSYANKLEQAAQLVAEKKLPQALALLDEVLGYYNQTFREDKTLVYSSRHVPETLFYVLEAANSKDEPKLPAKVYSSVWGDAYFLRGYIFVEQNRLNQARGALQSAVALGPRNAQYLNELGQLYLRERDWSAALRVFDRAESAAKEFSPEKVKTDELTLAWRGKGYALIELNRLDEATKMYRQNLDLVNDQPQAIGQLRYIDSLRAKQQQVLTQQQTAGTSLEQLDSKNFSQLWEIAENQNSTEQAARYLRSIGQDRQFNDGGQIRLLISPKDKALAECVTAIVPTPQKARLLFSVNHEGIVQRAWTDQNGFIAQCLSSKIPGMRLPAPPTSHYLLCSNFERLADDKTLVTGCGRNQWIESCETIGTTKRCSIQFKQAAN
jgi:tetratricopeptide (TPR) repeat protein